MSAESEMLARCRRGDPAAWDQLFDRHYAAAGRFICQLGSTLTREDIEEICQDTFLAVIRNLGLFDGRSQFQTWRFRVAANKAKDYQARQQAAKRGGGKTPLPLHPVNGEEQLAVDPPSDSPGPDAALMSREQQAEIRTALEQVGEPCREVIELRYFGDLSYEEISAALKLNPKTVSSRLSKCLDKLEVLLQKTFAREKAPTLPSNS